MHSRYGRAACAAPYMAADTGYWRTGTIGGAATRFGGDRQRACGWCKTCFLALWLPPSRICVEYDAPHRIFAAGSHQTATALGKSSRGARGGGGAASLSIAEGAISTSRTRSTTAAWTAPWRGGAAAPSKNAARDNGNEHARVSAVYAAEQRNGC